VEPLHLGGDFSECVTVSIFDQYAEHVCTVCSDSLTVLRAQILVGLVNFANPTILYIAMSCHI
jgi:hypothetical protein